LNGFLPLINVLFSNAISLDNSTLANMLPGVIDATLELVLSCQIPADGGGDCAGAAARSDYSAGLPGRFRLLYDESTGYEFSAIGDAAKK
jgi:hypothetical protein